MLFKPQNNTNGVLLFDISLIHSFNKHFVTCFPLASPVSKVLAVNRDKAPKLLHSSGKDRLSRNTQVNPSWKAVMYVVKNMNLL
jgi:hypothetical protein